MEHLVTLTRRLLGCHQLDVWLRVCVAFTIVSPVIFSVPTPQAEGQVTQQDTVQIVAAGVESSEDAPFASAQYRFMPGDFVYIQFQILGYGVQTKENSDVRKMSLTYEITPEDDKHLPLVPSINGIIKDELSAEDKNWTPKRRASFLLPSFVAAGEFHLHMVVNDLIGHKSTERDVPFHVGGTVVVPSAVLTVQDFQFLRKEDDSEPLAVPAYRPGDTIYGRFVMTGFQLGAANEYRLSYGLTVNRPDGRPYLDESKAAELSDKSFYPVRFVPGNLSITTARTSAHGTYTLLLTVRDATGSQSYQLKKAFTIE